MSSPEKNEHANFLISAYERAGKDFLAFRLTKIFGNISTEEDRILHNQAAQEVSDMIGEDLERSMLFLREVADSVLRYAAMNRNQIESRKDEKDE